MIETLSALLLVTTASQADRQDEMEDAYSEGDGSVELCGFSAPDFNAFLAQLAADSGYIEKNSTDLYHVYINSTGGVFRQIVVAAPRETAYPMAYCREVRPKPDGGSSFTSSMVCRGEKKDCDAVFVAFREHDEKIIASLKP